jgi:hypothetical protein
VVQAARKGSIGDDKVGGYGHGVKEYERRVARAAAQPGLRLEPGRPAFAEAVEEDHMRISRSFFFSFLSLPPCKSCNVSSRRPTSAGKAVVYMFCHT